MVAVEFDRPAAPLAPLASGLLRAEAPVHLPFMAPRLQGDLLPDGRLSVSIWGAGHLATLSLGVLPGPVTYGPNRAEGAGWSLHVAQSAPALLLRGVADAARVTPAPRCAWWHRDAGRPGSVRRDGGRRIVDLPWGCVVLQPRGGDLVVAAGADRAEAEAALALSAAAIMAEAEAHIRATDRLPSADPVLRSMVQQGAHAALSSIRRDPAGRFAGLAAGQAYSAPARTYYRDGYWTVQPLLALAPEAVRDEIDMLAAGIQPDGEAPSAVILSGPQQSVAWEVFRRTDPFISREHLRPGDWWSDHFDSPLCFILMIADYVRATGDSGPAERHWPLIRTIYARYRGFDEAGDGLPVKPNHERDWADNVYRQGLVAYDLGLWVGALDAVAGLGRDRDPGLAAEAAEVAARAREAIGRRLWLADRGWCAEYRNDDGFTEDHLAIDSLTLLRSDALTADRAGATLKAMQRWLYSGANADQPYGDWGVLCAFPPYKRRRDTRAKSAFAFRYHNGSDWPYWDGVLARELLRRGLPGWRYPLLRWWESCLENGWLGAVEYFSPPFGRGSLLQGWSGVPAGVALEFASQVLAGEAGDHQRP
ncbi:GH116 family glycosyl hydrolase [Inquilinus sp. NPDC058860]|uniref:GH116 family glycosyl hydrolase n=1 Tax=Inquilinus sp. NPDC058860 TaxID=3346652 RepID=UPI0036936B51